MQPLEVVKLADEWYALNQERLELQRQADALEQKVKLLKKEITDLMKESRILKVAATFCDIEVDEGGVVPTPRNWELIYEFILKEKAFGLLQRRLSSTGIQELWDEGIHVPGVDKYPVTKFKVTNRRVPE